MTGGGRARGDEERLALLHAFAEAYNRHDLDALMAMVTEDCVFETSSGPHPWGERHAGTVALREALPWAWQRWPDARWDEAIHVVRGDRGFSEWTFRATEPDATRVEVRGVDLFIFRDGRISRKDTFRKQVTR